MALTDTKKTSSKRKHAGNEDDAPVAAAALKLSGLEMLTDDEDDQYDPNAESDGVVDEFPEIDAASDTDDDDEEEEDFTGDEEEDEEDEEGEEESNSEDSELESDHHVGPRAKTVISDITGQPKKVYPEIEPDYDSDSSTEEVCTYFSTCKNTIDISSQGDQ